MFNLVLVGANECAVEYGMRWLNQVVANYGGPSVVCGTANRACSGAVLCYLSCEPVPASTAVTTPQSCLPIYQRTLRNAGVINGPTVTGRSTMTDGGVAWLVTMTLVAGNPYQYGSQTT